MKSLRDKADEALNKMVRGAAAGVKAERTAVSVLPADKVEHLRSKVAEKGKCFQEIPIGLITLDSNVRKDYDEDALRALCVSLKNEGLLQFPTIYIRDDAGHTQLVCSNGHRRILAAQRLGWEKIECVVVPSFQSGQERIYHVLNANLREDVYFLDLADAYADAYDLGEKDEDIAARVGVNPRTVAWYRRLAEMPPICARLAREYPKIFTATWAIQMARRGPLLPESKLHVAMQEMVTANRAWPPERKREAATESSEARSQGLQGLRDFVDKKVENDHQELLIDFVGQLGDAGLVPKKSVKMIQAMFAGAGCT